MSTLKLYEAVDEYEIVLDWIAEHEAEIEAAGGELPPELWELLDHVQGAIESKVGRIGLVIQNLNAAKAAARAEAQRLEKRARTCERQIESLKQYLLLQMRRLGIAKIETPLCNVRRQLNPPKVVVTGEIPPQYRVIPPPPPPKLDTDAVLRDYAEQVKHITPDQPLELDGLVITRGEHVRVW